MDKKVKLKGHESFSLREGWITKGIFALKEDSQLFSQKDVNDILGIGTNMVKSLKYWMLVTGVMKESRKSEYVLTELGELVMKYDPYLEDIFTLYFLHLNLVTNSERALVWNVFFNLSNLKNFSKKDLFEQVKYVLDSEVYEYNEKMLNDELATLLKTYVNEEMNDTPENNFTSPMTELKLIKKMKRDVFQKEKSTFDSLNKYIVLWGITNMIKENSISIDELINAKNSVCKLLNIDKTMLNEYLDLLKREELIIVNRTAGLNMVYINDKKNIADIFRLYYEGDNEDEI